jgi:endonuclease/exonuclease/phosphatase family metal-dependent hydrolase
MFTLVTYNTHFGKKVEKIADEFKNHPNLKMADVILFQEIEYHDKEEKARAEHIAEALGFKCRYAPARDIRGGGTHGIALLSKHPIIEYEVIRLPYFHAVYRTRTRIAQLALLEIHDEPVLVCNVHLDVRVNILERIEQMRPLILQLGQYDTKRIVVAGDFNTTPMLWYKRAVPVFMRSQEVQFRFFMESLGFSATPLKRGHSFRAGPFPIRLDEIYVKGLTILEAKTERKVRLSDHKPLWAKIEF